MNDFNINYPVGSSNAEQIRAFALVAAVTAPYRYMPDAADIIARAAKFEAYLNSGTPAKATDNS